jgi:hypothetical protein
VVAVVQLPEVTRHHSPKGIRHVLEEQPVDHTRIIARRPLTKEVTGRWTWVAFAPCRDGLPPQTCGVPGRRWVKPQWARQHEEER